ncbi:MULTISPECIES: hypothetical protein [Vibrio]|uniref:hypothetical protein n=1 Tax=Vibrio TaxID=662 RepID=UPI002119E3ED|nr:MULTISPECIES: hypothetical protein [Vibrio]MCQ9065186.1 ATP-binding protein [Vibrio diabolicus]MDW1926179.1 hypothetical protein [Vibrio sp. 947]HCG9429480.1 ATP-binding protein [Vibrio parahaemolyticus]HCH3555186.1 ATP-binding protein [Vibrio parahaemolyticus]
MQEKDMFVSESEFRKDIQELKKAVSNKDMKPIILFGESGIGKTPILSHIGGVHEIYKYGTPISNINSVVKDIIIESLNRGFHQEEQDRILQHVFSINDLSLFNEIEKLGIFRCFKIRRTNYSVLSKILNEEL